MRIFVVFAVLAATGCGKPEEVSSIIFNHSPSDPEWVTYEGLIPSAAGDLAVELELRSGLMGIESDFQLRVLKHNSIMYVVRGKYLTENSSGTIYLSLREYKYLTGPHKPPVHVRMENLRFKTEDGESLTFLNHKNFRHSSDLTYLLPKRQRIFTAEGYFSFVGDTTEFYELNTREYWQIASYGMHDYLKTVYKQVPRERFEGVYVRGLAYSIKETDTEGKETESIVFKNIIRVGSPEIASK